MRASRCCARASTPPHETRVGDPGPAAQGSWLSGRFSARLRSPCSLWSRRARRSSRALTLVSAWIRDRTTIRCECGLYRAHDVVRERKDEGIGWATRPSPARAGRLVVARRFNGGKRARQTPSPLQGTTERPRVVKCTAHVPYLLQHSGALRVLNQRTSPNNSSECEEQALAVHCRNRAPK
jgi:hypothetical protein